MVPLSNLEQKLYTQGLTIHDINTLVYVMFSRYTVLVTFTLVTNIGVKQAYILGSDGVRQLN
jgi:hypothetical protein